MKDNLTWQVTNKDLSKQLADLGVKQESLFYWEMPKWGDGKVAKLVLDKKETDEISPDYISAFTVSELGEMLPENCKSWKNDKVWWCEDNEKRQIFGYDDEADARARLLIYLIEKGFIKI